MDRHLKIKKNITKTALFIFLAFFICCAQAAADTQSGAGAPAEEKHISVDPTEPDGFFSAVLYDNTNGLPTAEANAIAETSDGFIWIGSYGGLIRYDGNTFERMDSTNGIASVVSLFVDSKDRLWIGTNDSGVAVMEKGEFRRFDKNDGLNSLSVRSISEDENGSIYIATTHGLAVMDENMNLRAVDEPQIKDEYIRALERGSDGEFFGVTMNSSIFTMKDGKLTGYYADNKIGLAEAHSIQPDINNPGYVYIGTKQSKIFYGKLDDGLDSFTQIDVSPLEYINSLDYFNDILWICADNGIGIIKNGEFRIIENIPLTSSAECITTDYQGNIWAASSKQGVMKIVPNQFKNIFEKHHLADEVVNSTCLYDGKLFIGTKSNGMIVIDDGKVVDSVPIESSVSASGEVHDDTDLLQMLEGCRIRSLIRDSKNDLWISTFGENGLIRFNDGKVTKFTAKDGMPSERVRAVCELHDGSIAVACTGGLAIINDDKITKVYNESSGISNTEILTVTEANNKDIVIGTDGDGMYLIKNGGVIHYGTESGLSSDVVMRIKKDVSRNLFWIVTSNSIAYMTEDNKIETVHKFPYSNNFDLYENTEGNMWILSSNGIYVASVDELLSNGDINTEFYGRESGLPCITTANSYSELTDDGELYISGSTGVVKVNINTPFTGTDKVKISVPYISADGTLIYPDDSGKFTIPSKTQKITIYSYVFNYSLMDPDVTYRLDGFDNSETTLKRSELAPIDYTNLRGGSYNFVMRLDDAKEGDVNSISVHIVKEKAFYEQIWFHTLFTLLLLTVIGSATMAYINYRNRQFIKKEKEQRRFIREIVEAFAKVIDMKDKYTNGHSSRVAEYTAMLAKELGCDEDTVEKYYHIALLHDIGKIGIPAEILNKPGKLTDTEFKIIKSHSNLGYDALKNISIMPEFAIGAKAHHERPDGKGYPLGLKGDEIPRVAQIIAVADTFDAMYSNRPYRNRMNFDKAVSIVKEVSGTQLTSDVVDAFLRLVAQGKFRDPEDDGGGTTENIDNIRAKFEKEE